MSYVLKNDKGIIYHGIDVIRIIIGLPWLILPIITKVRVPGTIYIQPINYWGIGNIRYALIEQCLLLQQIRLFSNISQILYGFIQMVYEEFHSSGIW